MKVRNARPFALWGVAMILTATTARLMTATIDRASADTMEPTPSPEAPGIPDRELLNEQAADLRERNPFRLERTPTSQAFRLRDPADAPPSPIEEPEAPALPALSVGGIVGGPPWSAVIEGVPGQEAGVLIREGEESDGVRVEWVRNDSVGVSAQDTAWTLALKQIWQR